MGIAPLVCLFSTVIHDNCLSYAKGVIESLVRKIKPPDSVGEVKMAPRPQTEMSLFFLSEYDRTKPPDGQDRLPLQSRYAANVFWLSLDNVFFVTHEPVHPGKWYLQQRPAYCRVAFLLRWHEYGAALLVPQIALWVAIEKSSLHL